MAHPYKPSQHKYKVRTKNPKKCFMCGIEFYGHWNKIYCGNANRRYGVPFSGCAKKRNEATTQPSREKWLKNEYEKWYEKYKETDARKESWKKASLKYRTKKKLTLLKLKQNK